MKTIRTGKLTASLLRSIVAPSLLFAVVTPAFGVINGSYVVNPNHTVTYTYEVDNSAGAFDIVQWALDFDIVPDWNQLDSPAGDVVVPTQDWVAEPGIPVTGTAAQDFLSFSELGDVLIKGKLGGFSFTSSFFPGPIAYHEFSEDGESASGQTIGPATAATTVPEGSLGLTAAMALLSVAAVGGNVRRAKSF